MCTLRCPHRPKSRWFRRELEIAFPNCAWLHSARLKTVAKPGLSRKALEMIANRFKVLSDPTRLQLLQALRQGERNVTELVQATGTQQANVSKHLALLADASMVARRRAGANVYYVIADDSILQLCELMCNRLQKEFEARSAEFE